MAASHPDPEHAPSSPHDEGSDSRDRGRADRSRRTAELLDLSTRVTGEQRRLLLDRVVLLNLEVAEAVAARYRGRGLAHADLVQAAYEGLVKAVHRFAPSSGNDLLTFAVPTVRGEVRRHFRDHGWSVRPPRRIQELQWRARRCTERIQHERGRPPATAELAAELGVSEAECREAMSMAGCYQPTSLDLPVGRGPTGTMSLGDALGDPSERSGYDTAEARVMLRPVLARLGDRDRRIVRLRFFEDRTQQQIAHALGVTQTQISKLLARILHGLRQELGATGEGDQPGSPSGASAPSMRAQWSQQWVPEP